jgi:uncharacterized protein (UPF0276 family)
VSEVTRAWAANLSKKYQKDVLLEWDNDVPDMQTLNEEMACQRSLIM